MAIDKLYLWQILQHHLGFMFLFIQVAPIMARMHVQKPDVVWPISGHVAESLLVMPFVLLEYPCQIVQEFVYVWRIPHEEEPVAACTQDGHYNTVSSNFQKVAWMGKKRPPSGKCLLDKVSELLRSNICRWTSICMIRSGFLFTSLMSQTKDTEVQ